ncbi:MAG TPA: cation:proton antiporter [Candidatus Omnitrophota bacterium]|nr:cation/H(+) antiporter [Candidatus Omnitrophota bacterium]HRK60940.1 cation:proton antiporter [Candidatus Omnitrophota bacterium]
MNHLTFLQDMAVVMAVSAVIMIVFQRFHLPVVLGYIIAGVVIGPNTPPWPLISNVDSIHTLSELGIIFLLFSIGLEFSFKKLMKVGAIALLAAIMEICFMIWVGMTIGNFLGWGMIDSLFLGAILAISSSTIIGKMLIEMKKMKEKFAQIIFGIAIIDDVLAILIIAGLSGLAATGSFAFEDVRFALLKVSMFIAGVLFFGFLIVPRLLRSIAKSDSQLMVITVLGLCFGVSLVAMKLGFSVGLGAFLVGAIIAETKYGQAITHKFEPIRDMFTAIFFVSIGMLFDPRLLPDIWLPVLVIVVITMFSRILTCSLATFLGGYHSDTALKVGLGLAQIGEFSFIIAKLGQSTGVTRPELYSIAVSVSALTTLVSPLLIKHTDTIVAALKKVSPKPLVAFGNLYSGMISNIGGFSGSFFSKTTIASGFKSFLIRFTISVAAGAFIFGVMQFVLGRFPDLAPVYYWALMGVALFPVLIALAYAFDEFIWNEIVLNLIKSREKLDESQDANQILHNVLRFLMVLVAGVFFLALGSLFTPSLPLTAAFMGLFFISGVFLWGSIRKAHARVEKLALSIFESKPEDISSVKVKGEQQELIRLIHQEYPWDAVTEDFLLPYQETAANQTLRDLRLRAETGATIVAIYRDEESIPNPPAETQLQPGDVLLLMGDQEQVKAAIQFLNKKIKEPLQAVPKREGVPKTQAFTIVSTYWVVGKTLGEIRLRRKTGTTVFGMQKPELSINSPGPDTLIETGDVLILFGWPDQLKAAFDYLSQPQRD